MRKSKPGKTRTHRKKKPAAAICTSFSENRKTGPVAVTYVSQGSCPLTCPLFGEGCYAEAGPIGIITARLNKGGVGMTPEELAEAEAEAIEETAARSDLRLHGVGDCRTDTAAARVAEAALDWLARCRYRHLVWTYTHAWQLVERVSWGVVSVLASCETPQLAAAAMIRGYAVAILLSEFDSERAYQIELPDGPATVIPCPYQTRRVQCVDCRLCMDDASLLEGRKMIGFKVHGSRRSSVVATLEVLNDA